MQPGITSLSGMARSDEPSRMEMITFFNRSLTGIRTLVSDQARKVKSNTKHAPKVHSAREAPARLF